MICFGDFRPSGYLEHLDECIVYAVQVQALGMGQPYPVPLCEHHPTRLPSRSSMDQHMIKPYWPSLGCGRCNTDQCQCPPMQQVENRSLVNKCKQSLDWTQDVMLEIKSRNGLAAGRLTG